MFRVIIAGSRDFNAKGADTCEERYAKEHGYNIRYFQADWDRYGAAAGPIRNEEMALNADALVAFWDGKSPGTKSMIQLVQKYNLQIRVKKYK